MRRITERDREIWRQNALRGTARTKGKRGSQSKHTGRSWGFEEFGTYASDRKKGKTRVFRVQVNKKEFGFNVSKHDRYGKNFYSIQVARKGKPLTDANTEYFRVNARNYKDARNKALKLLKNKGRWLEQ
jgi:hypothetical protein